MKFKKEVRVNYEPFAMGGGAILGTVHLECPKCHNGFQVPYNKYGDAESPLPKLCPFCGETFVLSGIDER